MVARIHEVRLNHPHALTKALADRVLARLQQSLYTILQILSVSIVEETPILPLFSDVDDLDEGLDSPN